MVDKSGTQELRQLAKDLGKMPKEITQEIRPKLKESASRPFQQARSNANWSRVIPGAIRIATTFSKRTAGVALRVSKTKAKHARAYENKGKPGSFRTRVFGNDAWVSRKARPFLWPAAEPWMESIDKDIGEVVDSVSRKNGFR